MVFSHLLAIVNNASMKMGVQIALQDPALAKSSFVVLDLCTMAKFSSGCMQGEELLIAVLVSDKSDKQVPLLQFPEHGSPATCEPPISSYILF
jgi:hypothetical protein